MENKDKSYENIKTVEDMVNWKNNKNSLSVEEYNKDKIRILGWETTDVLYFFLSIYVIGMLVFYPQKYEVPNIKIIESNSRKTVYSNKFVKDNYKECKKLNEYLEKSGFISHYFDIGNVIPIWPGGNRDRGMCYCYDLPEIYFNKEQNKKWFEQLKAMYKNAFLDDILKMNLWFCNKDRRINEPPIVNFQDTKTFLDSVKVNEFFYNEFINRIIGIINERTAHLNKYINLHKIKRKIL